MSNLVQNIPQSSFFKQITIKSTSHIRLKACGYIPVHTSNFADDVRSNKVCSKIFYMQICLEYCNWETFSAKCNPGHVVLMESAMYGRMRAGRCVQHSFDIKGNPHKMGCAEDIMRYFLFRSTKRVLQLGDFQCTMQTK